MLPEKGFGLLAVAGLDGFASRERPGAFAVKVIKEGESYAGID
jgi:hypothetical protein